MDIIFYDLPPSANDLFRRAPGSPSGRARSRKWAAWRDAAIWRIRLAADFEPLPPAAPWAVEIRAAIDRRRDLDNLAKPVLDALVGAGLVPDDRWCDRIALERGPVEGGAVRVRVRAAQ